jgi:hypothetical protein
MGDQNRFAEELPLGSPFIAKGYVESDYNAVRMVVGVVQLNAEDEIIGGAYGIGAADTAKSWSDEYQTVRRKTDDGELLDDWTMQLQPDFEKGLVLSAKLGEGNRTLGFVLTERPGGLLTGWIDPAVNLVEPEDPVEPE